ncbi:MAG TPA: SipW-dependent-type signal peptide-containing protein [Alphaproteobacteria bacterium]|jgi:predicted ribosomally synthesized peptide with SipW-like signal peptide|nr:SipW-dependent-type signal peptide-containing protein [Alphaproteobacteria bacterium]
MKNLLRSFVVVAIALTSLAGATNAYFTANVSASNNQITTGTMVAYVGSWLNPTGDANGQWVAYADKTGNHQIGNFPAITNVEPGVTQSGYVVVANYGSIPFHYQGTASGAWVNPALNPSYMTVPIIHRYAANNCEADAYCEDIYYWLTNAGYTNISAGATDFAGPVVGDPAGPASGNFSLSNMQFTIYRVDLQLSGAADNTYQGETFNYTLNVNASQLSQ